MRFFTTRTTLLLVLSYLYTPLVVACEEIYDLYEYAQSDYKSIKASLLETDDGVRTFETTFSLPNAHKCELSSESNDWQYSCSWRFPRGPQQNQQGIEAWEGLSRYIGSCHPSIEPEYRERSVSHGYIWRSSDGFRVSVTRFYSSSRVRFKMYK